MITHLYTIPLIISLIISIIYSYDEEYVKEVEERIDFVTWHIICSFCPIVNIAFIATALRNILLEDLNYSNKLFNFVKKNNKMIPKERLEQGLADWNKTLNLAQSGSFNELLKFAECNYTDCGLCYYFNDYDAFDEFIHKDEHYVSKRIRDCFSANETIEGIEKRIEIIKTLLSR